MQIGGVPAYSTLGWFNDPLISTFIHYPDAELARLIFHELSHQVVYVTGRLASSTSPSPVAVEEVGVERWLTGFGNDDDARDLPAHTKRRKQDFLDLLLRHRNALKEVYASEATDADKRAAKARLFQSAQGRLPGPEGRLGRLCRL